jgi:hypothetical protein
MIDTNPTDSAPSQQGGPSLFDAAVCPSNAFCEAFEPSGELRAHWQPVAAAVEATGFEELRQRQERVRRMRHEDGATYNPFDDPFRTGHPLGTGDDPVAADGHGVGRAGKRPDPAGQFAGNDSGRCLRTPEPAQKSYDSGGTGLRQSQFPAPLPRHPACRGPLSDLLRRRPLPGPDGRFRVLRDYAAGAAGVGYALENRIVISRFFSDLYHKTQIRRLAPFFRTFHSSLIQRVAARRDNPDIVLLSPGPDSRIYFEHALLSAGTLATRWWRARTSPSETGRCS